MKFLLRISFLFVLNQAIAVQGNLEITTADVLPAEGINAVEITTADVLPVEGINRRPQRIVRVGNNPIPDAGVTKTETLTNVTGNFSTISNSSSIVNTITTLYKTHGM